MAWSNTLHLWSGRAERQRQVRVAVLHVGIAVKGFESCERHSSHLQILGGVASKLQHLSCKVLCGEERQRSKSRVKAWGRPKDFLLPRALNGPLTEDSSCVDSSCGTDAAVGSHTALQSEGRRKIVSFEPRQVVWPCALRPAARTFKRR